MARILVVDDETALLRLVETFLKRFGHDVVCGATGREGLDLLDSDTGRFDVAVLDHWLPDMSGMDLLNGVLERRPDIRVLVASGSLMDVESLPITQPGIVVFLQKPYLPKMLAQAIDDLLQR